jgi:hypothetical protein
MKMDNAVKNSVTQQLERHNSIRILSFPMLKLKAIQEKAQIVS